MIKRSLWVLAAVWCLTLIPSTSLIGAEKPPIRLDALIKELSQITRPIAVKKAPLKEVRKRAKRFAQLEKLYEPLFHHEIKSVQIAAYLRFGQSYQEFLKRIESTEPRTFASERYYERFHLAQENIVLPLQDRVRAICNQIVALASPNSDYEEAETWAQQTLSELTQVEQHR